MYTPNELLFPAYVIPDLIESRGEAWQTMVIRVMSLPEDHEEVLAFMLMMIRMNGCMECETDSYRAMRGCKACALQTLRRYKGPDENLFKAYQSALKDVRNYLIRQSKNTKLKSLF